MRRLLSELVYGTVLAALAGGISCLLALIGFGRPYYLAVFLPLSALACVAVAWFLHLRDDRFLGSPSRAHAEPAAQVTQDPATSSDPAEAAPAPAVLRGMARWDQAPIPRTRDPGDRAHPRPQRALLWAAALLALAATLLYAVWGIGASYHS